MLGRPASHPGAYDPAEWAPVSTPVVVGGYYRGIDASGNHRIFNPSTASSLQLLTPSVSGMLVPPSTEGCGAETAVDSGDETTLLENTPAIAAACEQAVVLPEAVRLPPTPALSVGRFAQRWVNRASSLAQSFCGAPFADRRPSAHEGWPLFGRWEVVADENAASSRLAERRGTGSYHPPSPPARATNPGLEALEIVFVGLAELRSRSLPPVYEARAP
jgi:hypothetical protein